MNFTKMLTSCKEKRQGVSNQAFTVEKGSLIKCIASLKTWNIRKLTTKATKCRWRQRRNQANECE